MSKIKAVIVFVALFGAGFNTCAHNTSGLRSPVLARAMSGSGDCLFDVVGTVAGPESNADHFKGDAQDSPGLRVEPLAVQKRGYRAG
jgi:hypothetical protein